MTRQPPHAFTIQLPAGHGSNPWSPSTLSSPFERKRLLASRFRILKPGSLATESGLTWAFCGVDRYHIVPEELQMEARKECLDCQESKIITDFCLTKWTKDGRNNRCKECVNAKARRKYQANKQEESVKRKNRRAINPEPDRKYRSENREKCLERSRKWKEKNKDYCRSYYQEYEKRRDKSQVAERTRRRAVAKNNACPPWLTSSHRREMRLMFLLAQDLTARTGVKYHVDHIMPLKNNFCCGLHVPWNLRVIKASENLKKGNKFIPELGLTAC